MTLEIDHLLGEKEVAKLLSVSNALLQRWRCYGGGPAYLRIGSRSIRYRKQDIISSISLVDLQNFRVNRHDGCS